MQKKGEKKNAETKNVKPLVTVTVSEGCSKKYLCSGKTRLSLLAYRLLRSPDCLLPFRMSVQIRVMSPKMRRLARGGFPRPTNEVALVVSGTTG